MITGSWVTDEVKEATIEKSYVMDTIFEVWHFERIFQYDPRTKFTDYVNISSK